MSAHLYIALIDACELHGFAEMYSAAIDATHGDNSALSSVGIIGVTPASAHQLCKAIERAWLGHSLSLTLAAITRARGRHEQAR